jgi:Reverse transcriptase (RNA-dependent DNA polymerase)
MHACQSRTSLRSGNLERLLLFQNLEKIFQFQNFRPISLLSNMGKIFERLILNRIQEHERKNKIFIPQQFGFRNAHSTVEQILRITKKSSLGFNNNRSTGVVLLDLEKAFDSVWHEGLLYKMTKIKVPLPILGLVDSFLHNRRSLPSCRGYKLLFRRSIFSKKVVKLPKVCYLFSFISYCLDFRRRRRSR